MIVASTPAAIDAFRALSIAKALSLYAKTGIKVNRAYTPKAMMAAAAAITGQRFRARDYLGAAEALTAYARGGVSPKEST